MNSKTKLFILLCLLYQAMLFSQNLIRNGDFEIPDCMTNLHWFEDMTFFFPLPYTMDTTDCMTVRYVDTTHHLIASPQSGTRYTGSINIAGPRIQVGIARAQLSQPLEKDSLYVLEYYFRLAPWSSYAFNLGIFCFNDSANGNQLEDDEGNIISSARQCGVDTLREKAFSTDINRIYTNTDYWERYSDCYQAKGGEEYYELQMRIATDYNTSSYVWGDPAADIFKIMDQQDLPREAFHHRYGGEPVPAGVPRSNGTNFSILVDNMSLEKFSLRPYPEYTLEICPHSDSTTTLTRDLIQDDPYLHFHHAQFLWEDSIQTLYRSFADTGVYQLQVAHKCFTLDYTFHVVHKECEECYRKINMHNNWQLVMY